MAAKRGPKRPMTKEHKTALARGRTDERGADVGEQLRFDDHFNIVPATVTLISTH